MFHAIVHFQQYIGDKEALVFGGATVDDGLEVEHLDTGRAEDG
jgi:hypothetical protein